MRQKPLHFIGYLVLGSILLSAFYGVGKAMASSRHEYGEHEREHESEHEHEYRERNQQPYLYYSQAPRVFPQYVEECGSCHIAYPPQLLPAPSWVMILNGLDDHFGENAEVDEATRMSLLQYLAETSSIMNYRKMFRNIDNRIPLRITELPYFIRKHDEIPARYVEGNDKVGSFSQCNACHRGAERGNFDEDSVSIPGIGRWD